MKRDLVRLPQLSSSFLSCEKDVEIVLRKLFVESHPFSEDLVRMLVINTKDCLDRTNPVYAQEVKKIDLGYLISKGYIRLAPKIIMPEHEEIKSYIILSFNNFVTTPTNPQFRDCTVNFDILCHNDYWDVGNYAVRPLKIAGYIDGLLHNERLTGIGTFQFLSCNEMVLDNELAGYSLSFLAVHGTDDRISPDGDDEDE